MPQGSVQLRPVKVGRNFGESVEVLDGVTANDRLVLNPPDSLTEGDQVAVAPPAARPDAPPAKGAGAEQ